MTKVIVFEGSDGCGKSTQMQRLADVARSTGQQVHCFRNPGGTPLAEHVRTQLLSQPEFTNWERAMGMLTALSSTAQQLESIISDQQDHLILLDRWVLSTLIYQGCVGGDSLQRIMDVARPALGRFLNPDMYLVYQVPAEVAWNRIRDRGSERTVFERRVGIEAVCAAYPFARSLVAAPVIDIDGTPPEDNVWVHTALAVFGPHETCRNS